MEGDREKRGGGRERGRITARKQTVKNKLSIQGGVTTQFKFQSLWIIVSFLRRKIKNCYLLFV